MMFHHFAGLEKVHFVGVGGAGMSGIAEVLLSYEVAVSGSDLVLSEVTERLADCGVVVHQGHDAENVEGADLVVVSSAINNGNPEVVEARRRGIPVVRRAEMLAELMRLKYGIAIAGSHGKTTTTSLVGMLLTAGGLDPTVIVGGRMQVSGTGARVGQSDYLVAEADEFDRSFLRLTPVIAVLTNIDVEHLDTYRDLDEIREAFVSFASRVPFFGQVIVCLDDPHVQTILPQLEDRRVVSYGFSPQADLIATRLRSDPEGSVFDVQSRKLGLLGEVRLPMPGRHNVANALAAIAVGLGLDLEFDAIRAALASFRGVHRRFERIGTFRGAAVVDDYAHHPTEVQATLAAARQVFPDGRVHVIFQPHLYTRTRDFADDFGRVLLAADTVLVTDIYGSREEPLEGIDADLIVDAARASGHREVRRTGDVEETVGILAASVEAGDAIITVGAGDVYKIARRLAKEER